MECGVVERHLEMAQPTKKLPKQLTYLYSLNVGILNMKLKFSLAMKWLEV